MSLPDTVFIFVLALIIFGPKKLPEIGRQLGRLVGEFRRASNEFKFQIEEELRQAELTDRQITSSRKNELEATGSNPYPEPSTTNATTEPDVSTTSPDLVQPEQTLPVGQYPNIDTVDPYDLNRKAVEAESAVATGTDDVVAEAPSSTLTVRAADGTQPRTTLPYAGTTPDENTPVETIASSVGDDIESASDETPASVPRAEHTSPKVEPESVDPYAAPPVAADATHG